jgi:Family of unknown function (DUF6789)
MQFSLSKLFKGFVAGFIATVVLSILMFIKASMGVLPEVDPIGMISGTLAKNLGIAATPLLGWVMHFFIGTIIWGGLFAIFNPALPSKSQVVKGIILGIIAWLLMMIGPIPMAGAGFFGLNIGPILPVMTFVLHFIFGIVLGYVYKKIN